MHRHSRVGGMVLAYALVAPACVSALESPGPAPAIQSVLQCRKVADSADRLACFDKAVAAMEHAEATGDLVTVDREQRRAARHQAFGLSLPTLSFLDRGEKPEDVDRIDAKVTSASQNPYGRWTIRLDDGAVWRQLGDDTLVRAPHPGSTAEIRRGVLGSFTMKIDGQYVGKVRRES